MNEVTIEQVEETVAALVALPEPPDAPDVPTCERMADELLAVVKRYSAIDPEVLGGVRWIVEYVLGEESLVGDMRLW